MNDDGDYETTGDSNDKSHGDKIGDDVAND